MLVLKCNLCLFRCLNLRDWMDHLFSMSHQLNSSSVIWHLPENRKQRTVVVSNLPPRVVSEEESDKSKSDQKTSADEKKNISNDDCKSDGMELEPLGPYEQQFAWYFSQFGMLCDYYFDKIEEVCIIEVDTRECATDLLNYIHSVSVGKEENMHEVKVCPISEYVKKSTQKCDDSQEKVNYSLENPDETLKTCLNHQMTILTSMHADDKLASLDDQFRYLMDNFSASKEIQRIEEHKFKEFKSVFEGVVLQPHCIYLTDGGAGKLGWKSSPMKILVEIAVTDELSASSPKAFNAIIQSIFKALQNQRQRLNLSKVILSDTIDLTEENDYNEAQIIIEFEDLDHSCILVVSHLHMKPSYIPETNQLIDFLVNFDPQARDFVNFLLFWNNALEIRFPKSALIFLALFHLSRKKFIPSISLLQRLSTDIALYDDWNYAFTKDLKLISQHFTKAVVSNFNTLTLMEMTVEFFDMLSDVDFLSEHVICLYLNNFLPKSSFLSFEALDTLPEELKSQYIRKMDGSFRIGALDVRGLMCIQHPFNLFRNVIPRKVVKIQRVQHFIDGCSLSRERLKNLLEGDEIDILWGLFHSMAANIEQPHLQPSNKCLQKTGEKRPISKVEEVKKTQESVNKEEVLRLFSVVKKAEGGEKQLFSMFNSFSHQFNKVFDSFNYTSDDFQLRKKCLGLRFAKEFFDEVWEAFDVVAWRITLEGGKPTACELIYGEEEGATPAKRAKTDVLGKNQNILKLVQELKKIPTVTKFNAVYYVQPRKVYWYKRNFFMKQEKLKTDLPENPLAVEKLITANVQENLESEGKSVYDFLPSGFFLSVDLQIGAKDKVSGADSMGAYETYLEKGMRIPMLNMRSNINYLLPAYICYRFEEWVKQYSFF